MGRESNVIYQKSNHALKFSGGGKWIGEIEAKFGGPSERHIRWGWTNERYGIKKRT